MHGWAWNETSRTIAEIAKLLQLYPILCDHYAKDCINVDILGPMQSYQEHKFLMVVQDSATKIAEMVPIPNKSLDTIGTFLTTEWICKYGPPNQIKAPFDNHSNDDIRTTILSYLRLDEDQLSIEGQPEGQDDRIYNAVALVWRSRPDSKLKQVPLISMFGNGNKSQADNLPHLKNNR